MNDGFDPVKMLIPAVYQDKDNPRPVGILGSEKKVDNKFMWFVVAPQADEGRDLMKPEDMTEVIQHGAYEDLWEGLQKVTGNSLAQVGVSAESYDKDADTPENVNFLTLTLSFRDNLNTEFLKDNVVPLLDMATKYFIGKDVSRINYYANA